MLYSETLKLERMGQAEGTVKASPEKDNVTPNEEHTLDWLRGLEAETAELLGERG